MPPTIPDQTIPTYLVPNRPSHWDITQPLNQWPWHDVPALPPLQLADGRGPAVQQTVTRLCYDLSALYVRFECEDHDIWGTYTEHNAPIYDEEVVEVFIAAGRETPTRYCEFEISPNGVLFAARVYNPSGQREDLELDLDSSFPGMRWQAERDDANHQWSATFVIPWHTVDKSIASNIATANELPQIWRANFYRIERPRDVHSQFKDEYSCWSPTLTEPADFHKPERFGMLELQG